MARVFPRITASGLQATTYLLGIALFSISFLVFLNSTISFVVTSVIGRKERVGDAVGTLGFADELLAIVACPMWGIISDRVGVRAVAVTGYCIIGFSLICLVQSTNVYPELLVGRLGFSLGGAACSTMVTAVLPAMVTEKSLEAPHEDEERSPRTGAIGRLREERNLGRSGSNGHATSPSLNSELTITPTRYSSQQSRNGRSKHADATKDHESTDKDAGTSQLAGLVGFFTGAGALLALVVFLPLPAQFQEGGQTQAKSVQTSYYIVASIAFCVAVFIFVGLRNLPSEASKSFSALFQPPYNETTQVDADGRLHTTLSPAPSYLKLATESVRLGFSDPAIGLGYLGGFVARASSVGISLFVPLFVNAYFVRNGLCTSNPDDLTDIRENCERAYKLAAALSGIAETAALICAPLFGVVAGQAARNNSEWPLILATVVGIAGYISFGLLKNPDAFHNHDGQWAFISVILVGISQIGSIVCSLGLLGRGINRQAEVEQEVTSDSVDPTSQVDQDTTVPAEGAEVAPLLPSTAHKAAETSLDRSRLKGSIAGVYSLTGGAGILLLTKLGGALFDSWHPGAPFFLMAIFNAVLLIAILFVRNGAILHTFTKLVNLTPRHTFRTDNPHQEHLAPTPVGP